jgi:hypothetical protein
MANGAETLPRFHSIGAARSREAAAIQVIATAWVEPQ